MAYKKSRWKQGSDTPPDACQEVPDEESEYESESDEDDRPGTVHVCFPQTLDQKWYPDTKTYKQWLCQKIGYP